MQEMVEYWWIGMNVTINDGYLYVTRNYEMDVT